MIPRFDLTKQLSDLPESGVILVAVLNWGIGHATRCVSLIEQLQEKDYQVIIASDGEALLLLQQLFPSLPSFVLPSYQVTYAKHSRLFAMKMLQQIPKFLRIYRKEHSSVKKIVRRQNISAIISDNRFGIFHRSVPSIYITHQLQVHAGFWTFLTSKIHRYIINKYAICWIPDTSNTPNLSGALSREVSLNIPKRYIGVLSQFKKRNEPIKYDILVVLSGPEPQRSILETELLIQLNNTPKRVCFVKGTIEQQVKKTSEGNLIIYNYLLQDELEQIINQSHLIIARSGYSTIMDLAVLQKKVFFIPTPGQSEQIYLAKHLEKQRVAPYSCQKDFTLNMLDRVSDYKGF